MFTRPIKKVAKKETLNVTFFVRNCAMPLCERFVSSSASSDCVLFNRNRRIDDHDTDCVPFNDGNEMASGESALTRKIDAPMTMKNSLPRRRRISPAAMPRTEPVAN